MITQLRKRLQDPRFFAENRLPAHSDHLFLFAGETAPRELSLDGDWKFHYAVDLSQRVEEFERADGQARHWGTIPVPAHINLHGWGAPQYTNTAYPWDGREQLMPPQLPETIPVGQYFRSFFLPEGWRGEKLVLRFEGVEPAFRVWCNGAFAGYSEDSFTPAEFDVTEQLHSGENFLAVEVYRWASGSWLEDQDFWRFWGIFRSVKLLCVPKVHVENLFVQADATGAVTVRGSVAGPVQKVVLRLISPTGELAAQAENSTCTFHSAVEAPRLWSAECPALYLLELEVYGANGPVEVCRQAVGLRTVAIENGVLKLNGKRLVLHGVNRHEWNAVRGRVVTVEEMERDARLMKQNNINAVRTSHYPNRSEWYSICDRVGLYLIDEVNLETHGTWSRLHQQAARRLPLLPDDLPEWRDAVLDRAKSMFERDKNHPAVVIWSCGNESGGGETLYEMSRLLHQWDGARPVHYEGVAFDPRYPATTDIRSTMYHPAAQVESLLQKHADKPYIQVEYAHAMGNSCGALEAYIALEEKYPHYQGGFVWDWIDQQLLTEGRLQYGGDFRERPHDGDFCADGLLFADGTPSPKLTAVKAAYQPCKLTLTTNGVELENKLLFTDLAACDLVLGLYAGGHEETLAVLNVECPPGAHAFVPWAPAPPSQGGEVWSRASLRLRKAEPWAEAGFELAFTERLLRTRAEARSGWRLVDGSEHLGLYSGALGFLFNKKDGRLASLTKGGREWMKTPPRPVFWRAPVSNDTASAWPFEKSMWKGAELYQKLAEFSWAEDGDAYEVTAVYLLSCAPQVPCALRFRFGPGGRVRMVLDCMLLPEMEPPFVFGLECATYTENSSVEYDGLGPQEAAPDRLRPARQGRWHFDASKALTPYMKPQASGLRCGVRRVCCGGLVFEGAAPLFFSALPYTQHELENAAHPYDLPPSEKVVLRLLADVCGVGGDDTWGARPHAEFCLKKRAYHLECVITAEKEGGTENV